MLLGLALFLASLFLQIFVYRCHHRRHFVARGDIQAKTGLLERFYRLGSHSAKHYVALLEARETLLKRMHSTGREQDYHIVVERLTLLERVAHSAIHHGRRVRDATLLNHRIIAIVNIAHGKQELFLAVLHYERHQLGRLSGGAHKYLALTVLDIFLQIIRHLFTHAEILHRVGNLETQFLTQPEIMVDGGSGSEYYRCVVGNRHFALTKLARGETFNLNQRAKNHLNAVFRLQIIVWILFSNWLRLRNQNFFNLHAYSILSQKAEQTYTEITHTSSTGTISTLQRYKIKYTLDNKLL